MTPRNNINEACNEWANEEGGAWPWCANCGVRADLHRGSGLFKRAVERIIAKERD